MFNNLKIMGRFDIARCSTQLYQLGQKFTAVPTKDIFQPSTKSCPCVAKICKLDFRAFTTKTIQSEENVGILKKVLKKVIFTGGNKSRLKVSSCILYESVADKINYLEFFDVFRLPNTFNSWFLVTELHVWMLLIRAMAEGSEAGEDGRFLRNCIVEAMWADVNARAKKLGANNPSGTRAQIEILSEQFQAALISYDEGIMSDDKSLANAIWRRFFEMKCDDYVLLEKLLIYVREQMKLLDNLPKEEFVDKPHIRWIPLKELSKL